MGEPSRVSAISAFFAVCERSRVLVFFPGRLSVLAFLIACYATLHSALSVRPSVCRSVHPTVTLYFFSGFRGLWPHRSCPNDQVTSNKAPAHPHATGVAVYPALFHEKSYMLKLLSVYE